MKVAADTGGLQRGAASGLPPAEALLPRHRDPVEANDVHALRPPPQAGLASIGADVAQAAHGTQVGEVPDGEGKSLGILGHKAPEAVRPAGQGAQSAGKFDRVPHRKNRQVGPQQIQGALPGVQPHGQAPNAAGGVGAVSCGPLEAGGGLHAAARLLQKGGGGIGGHGAVAEEMAAGFRRLAGGGGLFGMDGNPPLSVAIFSPSYAAGQARVRKTCPPPPAPRTDGGDRDGQTGAGIRFYFTNGIKIVPYSL